MKLQLGRGNSGLTIYVELEESFNCVEFSTKAGTMQEVLVAPWIQFEPIKLAEKRTEIATEIIRRAMEHEMLIAKIESLESTLKSYQDARWN